MTYLFQNHHFGYPCYFFHGCTSSFKGPKFSIELLLWLLIPRLCGQNNRCKLQGLKRPNWNISPVVWSRFNLTRWMVLFECPMLISHVGPWNNSFNFICLISNAGKNLNVTLVGWANLHGSSNLPIPSRWAPSPVIGRGSPPITKAISPVKPFTKVI